MGSCMNICNNKNDIDPAPISQPPVSQPPQYTNRVDNMKKQFTENNKVTTSAKPQSKKTQDKPNQKSKEGKINKTNELDLNQNRDRCNYQSRLGQYQQKNGEQSFSEVVHFQKKEAKVQKINIPQEQQTAEPINRANPISHIAKAQKGESNDVPSVRKDEIAIKQSESRAQSNQQKQNQNRTREQQLTGLKNLGNTCYINSALQAIRQMYFYETDFLNQNSQFAKKLKGFFDSLNEGKLDLEELKLLVKISKEKQIHVSGGGDSYTALTAYLSIIINQCDENGGGPHSSTEDLNSFSKLVSTQQVDGIQCINCKIFNEDQDCECPKFLEPTTGLQANGFNELSTLESLYSYIDQLYLYCIQCDQQTVFKPKREILSFPNFLIVKFHRPQTIRDSHESSMRLMFSQGDQIVNYKLIGYCNHYGIHYTYIALYDDKWMEFSDSSVRPTTFNLKNAIYMIYQKN